MVRDKIFIGRLDVERVEVVEVVFELSSFFGIDRVVGRELIVSEDVFLDFIGYLFRGNIKRFGVFVEYVFVEEVGDSVVGYVDGRVGERFDKLDRVLREFRIEIVRLSVCLLVELIEDIFKGVLGFVLVSVEFIEEFNCCVSMVFIGVWYYKVFI